MVVHELFPVRVSQISYQNHIALKQHVNKLIDKHRDTDIQSDNGYSTQLTHMFQGEELLNTTELLDFKKFLSDSCFKYVDTVLGKLVDEMVVTECWLNICNKGGKQIPHSHMNSYVSGTYYVNVENTHQGLTFYNKQSRTHNTPFLRMLDNNKSSDTEQFSVNHNLEGTLLLWPSHIYHGYPENNKDNRISISMNFMPRTVQGENYSFTVTKT